MSRLLPLLFACAAMVAALPPSLASEPPPFEPVVIGRRGMLDVARIAPLDARLPSETLAPVSFRGEGGRRGWVVRMPTPRAPRTTTGDERLHTVPSAAVMDGRVYAGTGFDGWALFAFDAATGKHEWTTQLKDNGPSAPTFTPPTVTPRRLVCNTESCTTYAITPRSGHVAWSRELGPSVAAAPALVGETIYTGHRTVQNEYLLSAMRLRDGKPLWQRTLTSDLYGAPIHANGRLYVTTTDGVVVCFELDGTAVWFSRPGAVSAPWVTSRGVYVAEGSPFRTGPPAVRCLDPDTGVTRWRTDTEARWENRRVTVPTTRHHTRVTTLMGRWSADGPRPVVVGNRCYLAGGRDLIALDAATGAVKYLLQLPEGRRFHAPPAVLEGRLLFATLEGLLFEVDARSGRIVRGLDLRCLISSQPVVADGLVHVASNDLLYGIPWGKRKGPSWPQWGGAARDGPRAPVTTPARAAR